MIVSVLKKEVHHRSKKRRFWSNVGRELGNDFGAVKKATGNIAKRLGRTADVTLSTFERGEKAAVGGYEGIASSFKYLPYIGAGILVYTISKSETIGKGIGASGITTSFLK